MRSDSTISGDLKAYKFHVEVCLGFLCSACGARSESSNDIREDEHDAPYGIWQVRRAQSAMNSGWYVQPLSSDGSLTTEPVYCPKCAKDRHLQISIK